MTNIVIILLIITTIPYYNTKIYRFSNPEPFSGEQFYNPYSDIGEKWVKANFHAHSQAFGGLTKGKNTPSELIERYKSLGYDIICISNYNKLADKTTEQQLFFSTYEHGYNFNWSHQLVINAGSPSFFDFPFFQSKSHKQYIINKLKKDNTIIALAHPSFKHSYRPNDLKYLVNYDCMEAISPVARSVAEWDYALSNGHAVWIIGNDDAHDISDGNNGVCWTMINTDSICEKDILKSLKKGACCATKGWLGQEMNRITSLEVADNTYELVLEKNADSILLKSDRGKTVATATDSKQISYKIKPSDTYIRAEIFDSEPWNGYTKIYLNPVFRIDNAIFTQHRDGTEIQVIKTIIFVFVLFIIHLISIFFLIILDFKTPAKILSRIVKREKK
ncbi:MAG TPA: hypothetical protein PKW80_13145 [Bacteroidales bacterium]|nr:hypothetical protein [Bacteroidales bacterium]